MAGELKRDVSVESAHEVMIGIVALIIFVTIGTIVAGTNGAAGKGVLALFLAFAALQILFNADTFQKFLSAHPVITGQIQPKTN